MRFPNFDDPELCDKWFRWSFYVLVIFAIALMVRDLVSAKKLPESPPFVTTPINDKNPGGPSSFPTLRQSPGGPSSAPSPRECPGQPTPATPPELGQPTPATPSELGQPTPATPPELGQPTPATPSQPYQQFPTPMQKAPPATVDRVPID